MTEPSSNPPDPWAAPLPTEPPVAEPVAVGPPSTGVGWSGWASGSPSPPLAGYAPTWTPGPGYGPEGYVPAPPPSSDARRWGIGDVFIGLAIVIGLSVVLSVPLAALQLSGTSIDGVWITVISVTAMWAGFLGWPLYCSRRKGLGSLKADFGLRMEWYDPLIGLGAGIGSLMVIALIGVIEINVLGQEPESNTGVITEASGSSLGLVLVGAIVVLGAPLFEELFFRGLTFGAFEKRYNAWVALIVSTILFTVLHAQPAATLLGFVFFLARIGAIGFVLGLLRHLTGRLGASIVAHMTVNGVATIAVLASS